MMNLICRKDSGQKLVVFAYHTDNRIAIVNQLIKINTSVKNCDLRNWVRTFEVPIAMLTLGSENADRQSQTNVWPVVSHS